MKKLLSIFFIFTIFCIIQTCATAQVIEKHDIINYVEKTITKELEEKGYLDVQVNVLNVPFIKLEVPEGEVEYKITENNSNVMSREFRVLTIKVGEIFSRTMGIPVRISAYKNVVVAKEAIQRGSALGKNMLYIKKINVTNKYVQPLEAKDLTKPYIVTKLFRADEIIDKKFIKSQPDIIRNAPVTLYFKTKDNLSITIDGIAMSEGNKGDTITIKNQKYNKIYSGTIIDINKVLVRI